MGKNIQYLWKKSPQTKSFGLIDSAEKKYKIFKMTDGLQKRDYLYIDDLVKIITKLVNNCNKSGIYNIGKGKSEELKTIVNNYLIKIIIILRVYMVQKKQSYEPEEIYADTTKIMSVLNNE